MTLVSGQHPNLIAADDTSLYWTNVTLNGDALMMMPAAGGASSPIASTTGSITGLTLDTTNVYWVESAQGASAVNKAPLGGGTPTMIASYPEPAERGLAVNATMVYWPAAPTATAVADMLQAPLSGGTGTVLTVGEGPSIDFTVDSNAVYWMTNGPAGFECLPFPGGSCNMFLIGAGPRIKTNAYNLYTVENGGVWADVKQAAVEPTPTLLVAPPGPTGPSYGLALDANNIYWTTWGVAADGSGGTLMEVPISLGPFKTLASGLAAPMDIAVNDLTVYWVNAGTATEPPTLMMHAK
jgi:hypothetical protein